MPVHLIPFRASVSRTFASGESSSSNSVASLRLFNDLPALGANLDRPAAGSAQIVELVAGDRERRTLRTSVHAAATLPRLMTDPARVEPAPMQYMHDIGHSVARHRATPTSVRGKEQPVIAADRRTSAFS